MVNYWNSNKFGPCTILANFRVHCYESRWIHQVRTLAIRHTSKSANLFRFIDDLTAINIGGNLKEVLKKFTLLSLSSWRSNDFPGVFFLDLSIKVERKKFNIQVYDKKMISHFWFENFILYLKKIHFSSFQCQFAYAKHFAKRLRFWYLEC